jgi:hypothetical protein
LSASSRRGGIVSALARLAAAAGTIFLLASAVPSLAPAQSRTGLSLGATSSKLGGDDITVQGDEKWGFYGGAFGEALLSDILSVGLGLNYAQKGGVGFTGTGLLDAEKVELDLSYIEVPLLVELTLPLGTAWGLLAYGGVAGAYNTSCKAALGGGSKQSCKDTALGKATIEWGLPVGGGLSYTLANGESVVFEVRYTWGQNDAVADAGIKTEAWYFLIRLVGGG